MKKSIQSLLSKVQSDGEGKFVGGFFNIRGGYDSLELVSTNSADCSNKETCSGTNELVCTNNKCPKATNNSSGCSNTGSCYY